MDISKPHVILDAVEYATKTDITSLSQLVSSCEVQLGPELLLRIILTYLPEATEAAEYVDLLRQIPSNGPNAIQSRDELVSPSRDLSKEEAERAVRGLFLLQLPPLMVRRNDTLSALMSFLAERCRRIDDEIGDLKLASDLLEPFLEINGSLKLWDCSTLLPLNKIIRYGLGSHDQPLSLRSFEELDGPSGLDELLSHVFPKLGKIGVDSSGKLREIVSPWIWAKSEIWSNRGLLGDSNEEASKDDDEIRESDLPSLWGHFNAWLLNLAKDGLSQASEILMHWNGPRDTDFGKAKPEFLAQDYNSSIYAASYSQVTFATLYSYNQANDLALETMQSLLGRAASSAGLLPPPKYTEFDPHSDLSIEYEYLNSISKVHLLSTEFLDPLNRLTAPSSNAVLLAFVSIVSSHFLGRLGQPLPPQRILALALFGLESEQRILLQKVFQGAKTLLQNTDSLWGDARVQLLWLRDWGLKDSAVATKVGVFCRIPKEDLEIDFVKAAASCGKFQFLISTYIGQSTQPLPRGKLEKAVFHVAMQSFDRATNGNKSRGGMKAASDIIDTFSKHFPDNNDFKKASALISATNSLSYYSLTLQHGVPLLPANIAAHKNSLSLIDRLLKQNPKSYTKLDDLLDIGANFVRAGLIKPNLGDTASLEMVHHRTKNLIVSKAIEGSLAEGDFETAYSYVVNRLSGPEEPLSERIESEKEQDDTLWRSAYRAGCFQSGTTNSASDLRRSEQKMELLSKALLLAPASAMRDILEAWKRCETETEEVLRRDDEDDQIWASKAEQALPGVFPGEQTASAAKASRASTRRAVGEEAPLGLFDVAKGAAAAFGKSAFPLRDRQLTTSALSDTTSPTGDGEGGRVRKRDMVSNMVTGGLASGIGWVLGAPPVNQDQSRS